MRFYVYELVDPRSGKVFYVGKGHGSRMYDHDWEAQRGYRSRKCQTIRDIWAAGLAVQRRKAAHFSEESDAYAAEADLIRPIGLANLTNVVAGGVGLRPRGKEATKPFRWSIKGVKSPRPYLITVINRLIRTGTCDFMFAGERVEITDGIILMVQKMCADLGQSIFYEILGVRYGSH